MRKSVALLAALAACVLVFAGCEGDQGPAGPQGPPGGTGEFTYVGNGGAACMHCHATTVSKWETTGHAQAYDALGDSKSNLYCVKCHTTGFDSEVSFGDTEVAPGNEGPDVNGFDDYVGIDTPEAAARRADLEGVQCEACHGPMGPDFNAHKPLLSFSTQRDEVTGEFTSLCSPCHATQLAEWETSGHGLVGGMTREEFTDEWGRSSCNYCHTSEGFIAANDPAYADYEFDELQSFIGCVTCHDPHAGEKAGGNTYQLRNLGSVEVNYDLATAPGDPSRPRMEGYGTGQTCAQCHRARRDNANVTNQINNGSSHFGPHSSPQMDMFIGAGCYELDGYTYERDATHKFAVTKACVQCHMTREAEIHGETQVHAFHNFTVEVGGCQASGCHPGLETFDYKGVQSAIGAKLDELAVLIGYTDAEDMEANWDADNRGLERWKREAGYAFSFVYADGSHGVHNPEYAMSLLDNAIAYAQAQQALVQAR